MYTNNPTDPLTTHHTTQALHVRDVVSVCWAVYISYVAAAAERAAGREPCSPAVNESRLQAKLV